MRVHSGRFGSVAVTAAKLRNSGIFYALPVLVVISGTLFFTISYSNSIAPTGIVVHHSAFTPPFHGIQLDATTIDRIHERRGYAIFYWGRIYHIGYHYVILPDGTLEQGRPERCKGSHTEGHNSYIGICLIGNFSSKNNPDGERGPLVPTEAQMKTLTALCRSLSQRYHISAEHIVRHSQVNRDTECPGDRFPFEGLIESCGQSNQH